MDEPWTLTAAWVFPVSGPPLPGGTVTVLGDRIVAVAPPGAWAPGVDLGAAAVLPGLVNAHTHLDLSGLRGRCPPTPDFPGWLGQVIAHRRAATPAQTEADVRAGLAEALRFGTTLVGDVSAGGASWDALSASPLRAVVFHELLGLTPERAAAAWESWAGWARARPRGGHCRPGLSPHAPYSVRTSLFFAAAEEGVPVATHLAESAAELELLADRRGPFVALLKALGAWAPDGLAESPAEILRLLSGPSPVALAHGNYLRPDDPIPENASVVYCPRTHAAFGHPPHPFRDLLARGVRVALGTDSLASNPDLDLLAEARFLRRLCPDVPGEALLRMATLSGAEALGWADEVGSLEPGKSADLIVVPLPAGAGGDPHDLVLASGLPAARVLCRGAWAAP